MYAAISYVYFLFENATDLIGKFWQLLWCLVSWWHHDFTMTSWYGNVCCVTDPLWVQFLPQDVAGAARRRLAEKLVVSLVHKWIPLTKDNSSNSKLWSFVRCQSDQDVEQTFEFSCDLWRHDVHDLKTIFFNENVYLYLYLAEFCYQWFSNIASGYGLPPSWGPIH